MEQLKHEEIGNDINAGRGVAKAAQHTANTIFRSHWKRNVNPVDKARFGIGNQVVDSTDLGLESRGNLSITFRRPIVVEAGQTQTKFRFVEQVASQLKAEFRHPHNCGVMRVHTTAPHRAANAANRGMRKDHQPAGDQ